jgi:hypothetical protein
MGEVNMIAKPDAIDLRRQGKESFSALYLRSPGLFLKNLGCRNALRSLPHVRQVLPTVPEGHCRLQDVLESGDCFEIRFVTEARWVDYQLGFLEALIEFFGEEVFVLVKTMKDEIRFQLIFSSESSRPAPFRPLSRPAAA